MSTNDSEFLTWLADRLVNVYGENPNVDFVLATRRIAALASREASSAPLTDADRVEADLREILDGMDAAQTSVDGGWWETSTEEAFGAEKLEQVIAYARALASPQAAPEDDLSNLTDEQIADAVECEFSETGEWPEGDAATFRAILKHAPDVMSFANADEGGAS